MRQNMDGYSLHIVPRGLIYPVDIGGLGVVRFGKKVGATLPILAPDNRFELIEDAIFDSSQLVVDRVPHWMEPNGYITLNQREVHQIEDIIENTITITDGLLADHETGEDLYHYSNPVIVEGNYLTGQQIINIDATHIVVRGDVVAVPSLVGGLITTFVEYKIENLLLVSLINGVYQYQVTLDKTLAEDLEDGQEIQIRAYIAYQSPMLTVPSTSGFKRRVSGPFLLDWVSAPLRNRLLAEETQTVMLYTTGRIPIGDPRVVEKNDAILLSPIRADQFLFWQKVEGEMDYDGDDHVFVMQPNSKGRWRLKYKMAPFLQIPSCTAAGLIVTVDPSLILNNEGFILDDSVDRVVFEYEVNGAYIPTPSAAATGSITVASMPADNTWITIDDGFGSVITFEFKVSGAFVPTPGRYTLNATSAVLPTDVAVLIREFLNGIGGFQITATSSGNIVNLAHDRVSTRGNQTISIDPLLLWPVTGMSGGTDAVKTIDIQAATTDIDVAQLTSSAINSMDLHIKSDWPQLVPSMALSTDIAGIAANIPITENVSAAGFIVQGMTGGSGGFQWNVTLTPTNDVLFRVRFYPNDWQDFNLTGGVATTISIFLDANDEPVEMIDMLIKDNTGSGEVLMGDWLIVGPRVGAIKYEYVARVLGSYNYASSTLFLKQIWQSLDDVMPVHDAGFALDNGYMKAAFP
jgi:hypothetical protein